MRVKERGGFSLLEIVLASLLFASLVTALAGLWWVHSRAQLTSLNRSVAVDIAELEMERTLALGFHDAASTTGSFDQLWEVRGQTVTHTFETDINVSYFVEPGQSAQGKDLPGLKKVLVTVTFDEHGSRGDEKGRFSLVSYLVNDA